MTAARYLLRSLLHYRFAFLGVLAGAALGATVLWGALFAGDSVDDSLRRIGANRIGQASHALAAGDRFVRQALADDLAAAAGVRTAPVLYARGTAVHPNTRAAANQVQLLGVTPSFWNLAPEPAAVSLPAVQNAVAINDALADRLRLAVGDTLIVRFQRPGILAGNAPVAGAESTLQSLRCIVGVIVDERSFGRFSLDATQVPSPSVFLPIELLQESLDRAGRANLILIDATATEDRAEVQNAEGVAARASRASYDEAIDTGPAVSGGMSLERALALSLQLADYGLTLRWRQGAGAFDLTSDRIFIDPQLADAVVGAVPSAQPAISYLVNEFRAGNRTTPYSIATATTREAAPFLPANLGPREIVLNRWLADDLQAGEGDEVGLTFFQAGPGGALVEQQAALRVRAIIPLAGLAADRAWMPEFPGISNVDHQSDWDPGLPLDLERIREQDERYWTEYRGAPKAFLSLEAGGELWSTRWGRFTSLRIPFENAREPELTATLLAALQPRMNRLEMRDLGASARAAAVSPVDFGGLFLGMSFFLIVASLGLVAMLFQLALLQRNREDALLGAVGLAGRKLLGWRLTEGFAILVVGCAIGLPLAVLYTRGILRFLESIWAGQAAGTTFAFAATPASIALGAGIFLLCSLLGIGLAIRKQARRALSIRLAAHAEETGSPSRIRSRSVLLAGAAAVAAAVALGLSGRALPAQGAFFLAGFSLLAAGIAACRAWMATPPTSARDASFNADRLGALNIRTRRSRSLTVTGMIATAVFMVLSVASFRKHVGAEWRERTSGTGGFAFWIETTAPLNPARDGRSEGFEPFEALAAQLGEVVPLRAGTGDNVNCFNLNSTTRPQLLAVETARLVARDAFVPRIDMAHGSASGWSALQDLDADGAIPALVDETTLQWALKRNVGDRLAYTDESGRSFHVRIAGVLRDSIFQGYLLVDEALFLRRFPSSPGYSVFLADAGPGVEDVGALRDRLGTMLIDAGGRVELTRDVLAAFHAIENTYIAIFNVLGTLGVVLGSLGLAIVVARNLQERRGEFAVMMALGIPRRVLGWMVFAEFGRLVLWGVGIGTLASAIAVAPNLTALPAAPTFLLVAGMIGGIVLLNLATGWAMLRWAMREARPSVALAGL